MFRTRVHKKLVHFPSAWLSAVLLVPLLSLCAPAQTDELRPEIDAYYKVNPDLRLSFQAKGTREGSEPSTAEIGPSLDFYLNRLLRAKDMDLFGLDDSKSQSIIVSVGYRYLPSPGAPPTNRMVPVVTLNYAFSRARLLLSDRNRADLDWQNGGFTWRYRNMVTLERQVTIRNYRPSPYGAVEVFYESKYAKWSTTAIYAGCIFPIGRHVEFSPYYEHQNNTGSSPNQQLNQLGLVLSLYFAREK